MMLAGTFVLQLAGTRLQAGESRLVDYVNPFIGTGPVDANSLSGNNFPGATTPFGLVQLSPDTDDIPGPCSGYNYNDKDIVGFSHTHLSGTGVGDLFDILVMPGIGEPAWDIRKPEISGYRSHFVHDSESARAGYYQVKLLNYNVNAELTATEHAGVHRYTFPQSAAAHILVDLNHSIDQKRGWYPCKIYAQAHVLNDHVVEGYRIITGWGEGYRRVYFRAEFSKPFTKSMLVNEDGKYEDLDLVNGHSVKVLLDFETRSNEAIVVKVGLSTTSVENARANLAAEVPGWDFDQVCAEAANSWEKELEKITVEGTREQKQIFYTALYHAFIQPNNLADLNGDYPATDMTTRHAADKMQFSTLSLWDTYRAANPLYTLIQTKRTAGMVNSMLRQYDTYGFLPIWQLWGLENYCMVGNHAIPVVVDASLKGIPGFDLEKAFVAVKNSSLRDHVNAPFAAWEKYGYIPEDMQSQSVSITLEMAYDDWCVAQLAKKLHKSEDYERFLRRSAFYKNLYDSNTGFFRAKNKDGKWVEPFDPLKYFANGNGPYTEGNAWQYLFYAPQDMSGLINLMGGSDAFNAKLDKFFTFNNQPSEKNQNASGFIGQYAHGNEPSHHAAYLYNFSGQPWKTQKYVAKILNELYNNSSSGYAGNEDCGQMSAWYIFSAMGFYPFNPVNGVYSIGSPTLKSARMRLEDGKVFSVTVENSGKDNCYIQSVTLNGKPYTKTYITQKNITDGGELKFVMGNQPNLRWGSGAEDATASWGY